MFPRKKTLRLNFLAGSSLESTLGTCGERRKVGLSRKEKLGYDIVTAKAQITPWGHLVLGCPCRVVPDWRMGALSCYLHFLLLSTSGTSTLLLIITTLWSSFYYFPTNSWPLSLLLPPSSPHSWMLLQVTTWVSSWSRLSYSIRAEHNGVSGMEVSGRKWYTLNSTSKVVALSWNLYTLRRDHENLTGLKGHSTTLGQTCCRMSNPHSTTFGQTCPRMKIGNNYLWSNSLDPQPLSDWLILVAPHVLFL